MASPILYKFLNNTLFKNTLKGLVNEVALYALSETSDLIKELKVRRELRIKNSKGQLKMIELLEKYNALKSAEEKDKLLGSLFLLLEEDEEAIRELKDLLSKYRGVK